MAGTFHLPAYPNLKPQEDIEPVNPFVIDMPTLAAQKLIEPPASIANAHLRQFLQTHHQGRHILGLALVIKTGSIESDQPAGAPETDLESLAKLGNQLPFPCGP